MKYYINNKDLLCHPCHSLVIRSEGGGPQGRRLSVSPYQTCMYNAGCCTEVSASFYLILPPMSSNKRTFLNPFSPLSGSFGGLNLILEGDSRWPNSYHKLMDHDPVCLPFLKERNNEPLAQQYILRT